MPTMSPRPAPTTPPDPDVVKVSIASLVAGDAADAILARLTPTTHTLIVREPAPAPLGNVGTLALINGLKDLEAQWPLFALHRLTLSNCQISDWGAMCLLRHVGKRQVTHLSLDNNDIKLDDPPALAHIVHHIQRSKLHRVVLSRNPLSIDGVSRLLRGVRDVAVHLDLSHCRLGAPIVPLLTEYLLQPSKTALDLGWNEIGLRGVSRIASALQANPWNTYLLLEGNVLGVDDYGDPQVWDGIGVHQQLVAEELSHNELREIRHRNRVFEYRLDDACRRVLKARLFLVSPTRVGMPDDILERIAGHVSGDPGAFSSTQWAAVLESLQSRDAILEMADRVLAGQSTREVLDQWRRDTHCRYWDSSV